jgi:Glycosyltransferase family 87
MRLLIATSGILLALAVGAPIAFADSGPAPGSKAVLGAPTGDGLPEWHVTTLTVPPPGLATTALQASRAAEATPRMQALHRRQHPLTVVPLDFEGQHWMVDFYYQRHLVAEAEVTSAGRVTGVYTGPVAIAVYARGHFLPLFDSWWVVGTFSVLFLLPFLAVGRRWRLAALDALAVLSFLVSYGLFNSVHLEAGVWLAYPPLLYLAARMAWIGFGRGRPVGSTSARQRVISNRLLAVGLLALLAARLALAVASHAISDVGVSSFVGAHRILDGLPLYYAGSGHADTYGPVAYLAYAPFAALFSLPTAAKGAAITFDLITVGGLLALGTRLRAGEHGRRLGLLLAWGWAACPFTLLALMMHTNDGLIAMLSVLALLMFASPTARGAMIGLATAAKFSPAVLLPLFANPGGRGRKAAVGCVVAFALVVVTAIGLALPPGGIREFYDHTIGYQLGRTDVFSPWALHPALKPIAIAIEGAVILLAAAVAFVPRRRSLAQVSALAAMLTIAVQLPAIHWFYYYIVWFVPFLLVALLAGPQAGGREDEHELVDAEPAPEVPERILVPA